MCAQFQLNGNFQELKTLLKNFRYQKQVDKLSHAKMKK